MAGSASCSASAATTGPACCGRICSTSSPSPTRWSSGVASCGSSPTPAWT
uniref:Uncharacterized protein n=1 Tax=Arundo donax TaxID=35708 RepID=A0A0A8Y879_ARUDO